MQEWVSILKYLAVEMTSFFFGGGVLEGRLGLNYVLLKKYIDICYINDVAGSVGRKWRWITYPVEISLLGKSASGSLQPWSGSEAGGKTSGPDRSLGDVVSTESCFVFSLLAYVSQRMQQQCISWEKPTLTYSQKCPCWILYPLKSPVLQPGSGWSLSSGLCFLWRTESCVLWGKAHPPSWSPSEAWDVESNPPSIVSEVVFPRVLA